MGEACMNAHIEIAKLLSDNQLASCCDIIGLGHVVEHKTIVQFMLDNCSFTNNFSRLYWLALDDKYIESLQVIVNDGRMLNGRIAASLVYNGTPLSKELTRIVLMCPLPLTAKDDYFRYKVALKYQFDDIIEHLHSITNITSCLVEACKNGDSKVTLHLVQHPRINPSRLNKDVIDACFYGYYHNTGAHHEEVLKIVLMDERVDVKKTFVHALNKNDETIVRYILAIHRFRTATNIILAIKQLLRL